MSTYLRLFNRSLSISLNKPELYCLNQIEDIFPISALDGEGISDLLEFTKQCLPKRKQKYSKSKTVLLKKDLFYSEITREKIYDKIHKEIPYLCKVHTERIKKTKDEITIHQRIAIIKKSHK